MIPLRDIISTLKRVDLTLMSTVITSLQKFVFVLYISTNIWNGTLFDSCNKYLMPNKPDTKWLSFFTFSDYDECETLTTVFVKEKCIRSIFLKDQTDVYSSAVNLQRFSKWHYLVIVMFLQTLAPYAFQLSLLLVPLVTLLLKAILLKKIMYFFGYERIWRRARQSIHQLSSRSRVQSNEVNNILCLSLGIWTTSLGICFASTSSLNELKSSCRSPVCLYCYPRLIYTIFKDQMDDEYYYYIFGASSRFMLSGAKLLSAALLSYLLYVGTVFTVCLAVYIIIDAIWSMLMTFKVLSQYGSTLSPQRAVHSLWNNAKTVLHSPRTQPLQDSMR